jgi:mono/diheme cytochrome c family protein
MFAAMMTAAGGLSLSRAARGAGDGEPAVRPASSATAASTTPAAQPDSALYRRDCRRCHGDDGKGLKRDRLGEIPDFTDSDWQASRGDADLQVSILEGKGTHMPAFSDRISEDEARQLASHVRGLGAPHKSPPSEETTGRQQRCSAARRKTSPGPDTTVQRRFSTEQRVQTPYPRTAFLAVSAAGLW